MFEGSSGSVDIAAVDPSFDHQAVGVFRPRIDCERREPKGLGQAIFGCGESMAASPKRCADPELISTASMRLDPLTCHGAAEQGTMIDGHHTASVGQQCRSFVIGEREHSIGVMLEVPQIDTKVAFPVQYQRPVQLDYERRAGSLTSIRVKHIEKVCQRNPQVTTGVLIR